MEGKVKTVDQAKKQVTLEDGTSFTIPATVQVEWATITPGKTVLHPLHGSRTDEDREEGRGEVLARFRSLGTGWPRLPGSRSSGAAREASGRREVDEMNRRFEIRAWLMGLALGGAASVRDALAQGLPTPGPGGSPPPAAESGSLVVPMVLLFVALVGGLVLAVALADLRRKRRMQAIAIEGQISDALMREPRLACRS